jgi:hypothetical protein
MTDAPEEDGVPWKWAQLLFGSGVLLYMASATFYGIWWAADISKDTRDVSAKVSSMERRFEGLDNVSLGNRITQVEVKMQIFGAQQDRMERKIDRLLERRYGNSPSTQSGGREP